MSSYNFVFPIIFFQVRHLQKHGDIAFRSKDYPNAVMCYSEALEIDTDNAQILARRAVSYIELKDYTKAEEDARLLVKLNPHVPQVRSSFGLN